MYDNDLTRCAENDFTKVFCIVTCLWIVGWPLKLMLGYDDNSSLTAYYRLGLPMLFFISPRCLRIVFQHDCTLERIFLPQLQQHFCSCVHEGILHFNYLQHTTLQSPPLFSLLLHCYLFFVFNRCSYLSHLMRETCFSHLMRETGRKTRSWPSNTAVVVVFFVFRLVFCILICVLIY